MMRLSIFGRRFWWPWFSEECDECGHKTRRWRGLWYHPAHLDSALASYFISGMPVFEHTYLDIRDYEGVFQCAAVISHDKDDAP